MEQRIDRVKYQSPVLNRPQSKTKMQIVPIGQILTLAPETPLPCVQGAVKKQGPRKQAPQGKHWSFEIVQIQDASGVIDLKFWNRDPLPSLPIGTVITATPAKSGDVAVKEKPAEGQYPAKKSVDIQKDAIVGFGQPQPGPQPAAYQPAPGAYQPQPQAQPPWQPPAAPAPTAQQPMDFSAQFPPQTQAPVQNAAPSGDPVAFAKKRAAELGGLQYYCLRIARHNLAAMAQSFPQDEFNYENVCSQAASLFIALTREGCNGTGFMVPTRTQQAPQSAPAEDNVQF